MIAVPDFAAGAMENWGLITYRASSILFDKLKTSTSTKTRIATTITHELAHMWFGNLVTMRWWNDLWLNEGFATFMQFLSADHIYPELQTYQNFLTQGMASALNMDALETSHPIEVKVDNPAEIGSIFDAISYRKGCSIIRMVYYWMGDKAFRKGIFRIININN